MLKDFLPHPALTEFVQCYRIVHFEFDLNFTPPVKAYSPAPEECLNFYLTGKEQIQLGGASKTDDRFLTALVGQQTAVFNRYVERCFFNFQIVFQPSALFRLTGIPSCEFTNKYVDGQLIFSKKIRLVHDQLQHATNYEGMLLIADKFVAALAADARKSAHRLDSITGLMLKQGGNVPIDWLAKESCLCNKQFKRKFSERVGVNPKTYARIIQFTKAVDIKNSCPQMDWLAVAVHGNYYDYQHLAKSYLQFTGLTPTRFHLLQNTSPEGVLGIKTDISRGQNNLYTGS